MLLSVRSRILFRTCFVILHCWAGDFLFLPPCYSDGENPLMAIKKSPILKKHQHQHSTYIYIYYTYFFHEISHRSGWFVLPEKNIYIYIYIPRFFVGLIDGLGPVSSRLRYLEGVLESRADGLEMFGVHSGIDVGTEC